MIIYSCVLVPLILAFVIYFIFFAAFDTSSSFFERIFGGLLFTVIASGLIFLILRTLKHGYITANIVLDLNGISYQAREVFFIPWDRINRIEVKYYPLHVPKIFPKPYIVFYTNYSAQKNNPLEALQISDDFIFTHYSWEFHRFIEKQINRPIKENWITSKRFRNREYRKRNREMNRIWRNRTLDK